MTEAINRLQTYYISTTGSGCSYLYQKGRSISCNGREAHVLIDSKLKVEDDQENLVGG